VAPFGAARTNLVDDSKVGHVRHSAQVNTDLAQAARVTDVVSEALQLVRVTGQRIEKMGAEIEESGSLDDLQLVGRVSEGQEALRLAFFKEKKKQVYLETLLKQLNDCFAKLKRQHGAAQTKRLSKELKEQHKQRQEDLEKKASSMIMSVIE